MEEQINLNSKKVLLHVEVDDKDRISISSAFKDKVMLVNLLADLTKFVINQKESNIIVP